MNALELLSKDHRAVSELLGPLERGEAPADSPTVDEVVRALSVHAAAEELVFYPAVRDLIPTGTNTTEQHLKEHQLVKELLAQIERADPVDRAALLAALAVYVRVHVEHEEQEMFPIVRQHVDESTLEEIGQALEAAKRNAPTHPHPRAPRRPPANFVAGAAASVMDRFRDRAGARR